jgi:hypothetical protein
VSSCPATAGSGQDDHKKPAHVHAHRSRGVHSRITKVADPGVPFPWRERGDSSAPVLANEP